MKKLIVFCDGTWNRIDETDAQGDSCVSNVAKLFESTCFNDGNGNVQITHYIQGIGTKWYDKFIGGIFGWGISENIKDGYKFLCSNYENGDEIYLFGFSRGAFTARSLAGLIHNMGILKRSHINKIDFAYEKYRNKSIEWHPNPTKGTQAECFRKKYAWGNEKIKFLGVWDTVGALGSPYGLMLGFIVDKIFGCRFHDTKLSSSILSASHAISKNEHRWSFRPTLWGEHNSGDFTEKWFSGVHADVGGGYAECGYSDEALHWMVSQVSNSLKVKLPKKEANESIIHDSQRWYYRLPTILFVKFPAALLVDIPSIFFVSWSNWIYKKLNDIGLLAESDIGQKISRIQCNGDYLRK